MTDAPHEPRRLDTPVDIKIKLAALWASATLCYLYCDYFELYQPGKLAGMLDGQMRPLGDVGPGLLLGTSVLLSVPAVMIVLCVALPARIGRVLNLLFGTLIMAVFLLAPGVWLYYKYFAAVEMVLTGSACWLAWRWPRSSAGAAGAGAASTAGSTDDQVNG